MDLDEIQLGLLQQLWTKPEVRDAIQRLVYQSVVLASVELPAASLGKIYEAMESVLAGDAEDKPKVDGHI